MISLRWKISGVFVLSNIVLGTLLVFIINNAVSKSIEKELIERGKTIASNLATYTSELILSNDVVGLRQTITNALSFESVEYILIQDGEKKILAEMFNGQIPKNLKAVLDSTGSTPRIVNLEELGSICYDIVVPVEDGYLGYIRVGMKKSYIDSAVGEINKLIIAIIAGLTLLGILVVIIVSNKIISPIIYLTNKANDLSQGNLDEKVIVKTNDEIQYLGEALERLRESVKIALDRLKKRQTTRI